MDSSILQTLASIPCVDSLKHAQTIIDELRGKGLEIYHAKPPSEWIRWDVLPTQITTGTRLVNPSISTCEA